MLLLTTTQADETRNVGRLLGSLLRAGDIIELSGPLGAGKTEFVRGLIRGLGIADEVEVQSPTFTIVNEYPGELPLYHLDLYRVHNEAELLYIGIEHYFYGEGVTAVEWLSLCPSVIPSHRLRLSIDFTETGRSLQLEAFGDNTHLHDVLTKLQEALKTTPCP